MEMETEMEQVTTTDDQVLTFSLAGVDMALPVDEIKEVLVDGSFEEIPLAPDFITGLFTLRGQIVTGIDLRKRFSMEERSGDDDYSIIIVETGAETIGFIVDEVGDVMPAGQEKIEELPANMRSNWQQWEANIIREEETIRILLNTHLLIN